MHDIVCSVDQSANAEKSWQYSSRHFCLKLVCLEAKYIGCSVKDYVVKAKIQQIYNLNVFVACVVFF